MTNPRIFRRGPARACALLLAAGAFSQAGAGELPSAYVMAVFDDRAQGQQLVSGQYEEAIAVLAGGDKGNAGLEVRNNLCVAYAMTKRLSEAEEACVQALRSSRKAVSFRNHSHRRQREDRAVAYSNRGVIRALSGDVEGAMEDFRRAVELSGTFEPAAHNLARLNAKVTQSVSSVQHAH